MIAFIGSVFSPYYAWARRRSPADPLDHCAVNVVLYGPRGKRWAMTERPRAQVERFADALTIGSSELSFDGDVLKIEIDEMTAPFPTRIRGSVRLYPSSISETQIPLDSAGIHHWRPIAPCSHVEVDLERPGLRWSGSAYLDGNIGNGPLEDSFSGWSWSRAKIGRDTAVLYDVVPLQGNGPSLTMRFDPSGKTGTFESRRPYILPKTGWRVSRETRADDGHEPRVERTLEDSPFYARSLLSTRLLGQDASAIHESLSLDRFKSPVVQAMLPFRMPRWPL